VQPMGEALIPGHLPGRLAITLWDFSWYTQAAAGEPFHDLDQAFAEAVERGYNTVRICAMPYLLCGEHGLDTTRLALPGMGGSFGLGTRWYNSRGGAVVDPLERLLELFRAARRSGCYVIVSSWEYQQSPAFAATPDWYKALYAVPEAERLPALTAALGRLVRLLKAHDLADRIAYVELHNEIEYSRLVAEQLHRSTSAQAAVKDELEASITALRREHPDVLVTACYAKPPTDPADIAENMQVAHFHTYVYGVLGALADAAGLNDAPDAPVAPLLRDLLRPGAPDMATYAPAELWRLDATGVRRRLFYAHDWVDPVKWDGWLDAHYPAYRDEMAATLAGWLKTIAGWARARGVPAVVGEGYVGYTPLHGRFEESAAGKEIAELAIRECVRLGYWGAVTCSNAAPHHPFWSDVTWQREMNALLTEGCS
jgi:hypothetical protein